MKTPEEIASSILDSAESHKRRATQIKRVAGGLRSEISNGALSEPETKVLVQVLKILDDLSGNYAKAAKISLKRREQQQKRDAQIKKAMQGNFAALTTVADRVAFVAAKGFRGLETGSVKNKRDLDFWFDDAIASLAYQMSRQPGDEADVVAAAWVKFEAARKTLISTHTALIEQIAAAA